MTAACFHASSERSPSIVTGDDVRGSAIGGGCCANADADTRSAKTTSTRFMRGRDDRIPAYYAAETFRLRDLSGVRRRQSPLFTRNAERRLASPHSRSPAGQRARLRHELNPAILGIQQHALAAAVDLAGGVDHRLAVD